MIKRLIIIFIFLKLSYFFIAFLLARMGFLYLESSSFLSFSEFTINKVCGIFGRWDYGWYKDIAINGYLKVSFDYYFVDDLVRWKDCNWGFFPLWPILLKLFYFLSFNNLELSAFILTSIISFVLLGTIFNLFKYYSNEEFSYYCCLLFLFAPNNFYFSCYMTEAPFLLSLVASYWAIVKRSKFLLIISISSLALLRPTGLIVLPAIMFFYLTHWIGLRNFEPKQILKELWPFIFPITFYLLFNLYAYSITGDFFAYKTAQIHGWNKHFTWPWKVLFTNGKLVNKIESIVTLVTIFLLVYGYYFKIISSDWFYIAITISALILFSGNTSCNLRYISCAFPLIFIIAHYSIKNKILKYTLPFLFLAFHFWMFGLWLVGNTLTI